MIQLIDKRLIGRAKRMLCLMMKMIMLMIKTI